MMWSFNYKLNIHTNFQDLTYDIKLQEKKKVSWLIKKWTMRLDLCNPDSLGALYVDQAGLKKKNGVGFSSFGGTGGSVSFWSPDYPEFPIQTIEIHCFLRTGIKGVCHHILFFLLCNEITKNGLKYFSFSLVAFKLVALYSGVGLETQFYLNLLRAQVICHCIWQTPSLSLIICYISTTTLKEKKHLWFVFEKGSHYIDQVGLELTGPPTSSPLALRFKVWRTMSSPLNPWKLYEFMLYFHSQPTCNILSRIHYTNWTKKWQQV